MIRIPGARRCGAVGRTGRPGLRGALGLVLVAALLTPGPAGGAPLSQAPAGPAPQLPGGESQLFPETGFRLGAPATDPFGEYFAARGGVAAFGYPVSRRFTLQGHRVQVFQRAVMQQQPAGVGLLNLLDEAYLPYTDFGTAAVPPLDPAVAAAAPPPGTPDYGAAVSAYVAQAVPNVWQGQPVGFRDAFLRAAGQPADAPALQVLVALEVLGFPTSAPAADPRNPLFVYQRFQRAVLQYDATTGLTQPLLLADFLKSVMTGRDLPPDLATQAQGTRFFLQYRPGTAGWVARPADLPDTDLTQAFEPDEAPAGALPAASPRPEAPLPPPPAAVTRPSATRPSGTLALTPPPPFPAPSGTPGPATATATATATPTGNPQAPVVEGAEPGGAAVGQDVLLRGRHFGDQPGQVLFTGKLAQAQVWSNTLIVVTVPQGAADGTVRVRRADGALSNAVGFAPATTATPSPTGTTPTATPSPTPTPTPGRPTVAGIEPHFGGVGSAVLVRGAGFGSTTGTVLLGSQTAPVQLWSDTSVLVLVPTGADTQPQRTQRLRVLRADGATGEPVSCFVVSPGTPTPTPSGGAPATPVPVTPTPVPPPPPGC